MGTVDNFQGQEAPIVIYSMATSTADEAPRGMEFLYSLHRLNVATSRARCVAAIVVLLLAGAGCSSPDRPKRCGSWLQLSPSVAASCFATGLGPIDWPAGLEPLEASGAPPPPMPAAREEGGAASATLELLVLWRGTPGWFLRPVFDAGSVTFEGGSAVEVPDGSVSFEDRAVYPRFGPDAPRPDQGGGAPAGRRLGSMVTIRQGGVLLELRFDPQSAVAYVQEQPIRLNGDNVVLVDDVDGPAGPRVVGTCASIPVSPSGGLTSRHTGSKTSCSDPKSCSPSYVATCHSRPTCIHGVVRCRSPSGTWMRPAPGTGCPRRLADPRRNSRAPPSRLGGSFAGRGEILRLALARRRGLRVQVPRNLPALLP